jgi:RND family efflux transporter MFP subunit
MKWMLGVALLAWHVCAGAKDFACLIEPAQVVEIRASVEGVIVAIYVQRGDMVKKGQALVALQSGTERVAVESARYRAQMEGQVTSARARLDYATKKLARLNGLQQMSYASAQQRDEADAEFSLAKSELQVAIDNRELAKIDERRAKEQLALRTLVSPFSGVVVDRVLNPGDLAESGTGRRPLLKVAQIDPMKVDVVLPAALFGRVKVGQKASVQAEVGSGRYAATVQMVDRVIDAASGTFVARLQLPNPKHLVPGGSRCSATIVGI